MSETAINVENLSKRYRLKHQQHGGMRYKALRDVLADRTKSVARRCWSAISVFGNGKNSESSDAIISPKLVAQEDFWALRGVSFQIKRGEVVGIIGRNGAGKSTLLKILSRITEPTEGRIHTRGRIASLLEVGTGFHPELTGRENIFLNGAILGMRRAEIKKKFDEIVDFAEIERFLDTPVKRYSSGMYVRLAFAVAAHLEPEILVVDEVLAVGDSEFQRKCLGKMQSVAQNQGRTVLFVSHNMKAVQKLCRKGVVLENGRKKYMGTAEEALRVYSETTNLRNSAVFSADPSRPSITSVTVETAGLPNGNLVVDIRFKSPFPLKPPIAGLVVYSLLGTPVFGSNPRFHTRGFEQIDLSEGTLRMTARNLAIHGGGYKLSVWLGDWQTDYDEKRDALSFEFREGSPALNAPNPEVIGFIDSEALWSVVNDNGSL